MSLTVCVVCFIFSVSLFAAAGSPALRVVDGRNAEPGEFPYALRLEAIQKYTYMNRTKLKSSHYCTGAALTPTWSLTAAHCHRDDELNSTEVVKNVLVEIKRMIRYGSPHAKPSENNQLSAILKIKRTGRKGDVGGDDIKLLYNEPIMIERYAKLSALDYSALRGREVALIGFGLTRMRPDVHKFSDTKALDRPLQVIDKAMLRSCDVNHASVYLCVVPVCGTVRSTMRGDSGGPVVHGSGIVGVDTAGTDPLLQRSHGGMKHVAKHKLTIITPVSLYIDWIYAQIHGNQN